MTEDLSQPTVSHTPGPWEVTEHLASLEIRAECERHPRPVFALASIFHPRMDGADIHAERIANARLIAAAPELLTALAELLAEADATPHRLDTTGEEWARRAIAHATGRPLAYACACDQLDPPATPGDWLGCPGCYPPCVCHHWGSVCHEETPCDPDCGYCAGPS